MDRLKFMHLSLTILLGLGITGSAQILAESQVASRPAIGDCSKDFLIAYFPPSLVEDALKKANVPQDKWEGITKALTASENDIINQVEDKASKITPNPLKDPQQRQVALKIFRETLLQVFSDVLKKNGITDDKQIQNMLDGIQQEKAKKFADCLEQHKRSVPQTAPTQAPAPAPAPAPEHENSIHDPIAAASSPGQSPGLSSGQSSGQSLPGLSKSPSLTPHTSTTTPPATTSKPLPALKPLNMNEHRHYIDSDENDLYFDHEHEHTLEDDDRD